jgi:hypothetical protein
MAHVAVRLNDKLMLTSQRKPHINSTILAVVRSGYGKSECQSPHKVKGTLLTKSCGSGNQMMFCSTSCTTLRDKVITGTSQCTASWVSHRGMFPDSRSCNVWSGECGGRLGWRVRACIHADKMNASKGNARSPPLEDVKWGFNWGSKFLLHSSQLDVRYPWVVSSYLLSLHSCQRPDSSCQWGWKLDHKEGYFGCLGEPVTVGYIFEIGHWELLQCAECGSIQEAK